MNRRIKVLMFGWEFPPHISGGLGTACYGLTKGLMKHNTEVFFVVPKAYGDEDQQAVRLVNGSDESVELSGERIREFQDKLKFIEVDALLAPYMDPVEYLRAKEELRTRQEKDSHLRFKAKFDFSGKYGANLMEEVARYALVGESVARRHGFDVIHAHDWLTYQAGIAAKRASGKPLVVHIHATEFDRSGENVNQLVYDIEREGMQAADLVIAVSNFTRNVVIERYGIDPDKVITVHNAVEPTELAAVEQEKHFPEKVVTFLGRITYQKGPEYFVEAAHKILQKDRNVRFVMAGSGDMMEKMVRRVARLGIADRFHFTGFLRGENIDRLFAISDVFVMPSVSEPFGIVPLEAMRSNVPVVISKQSGVSEVLQHALKVDFWDTEGLADAIYGLLNYKALSDTFSRYGKDEVDNLKWENAAAKVVDVYSQALTLTL
jgi:glycosyltransferase involved in cell wall biosynthesis